MKNKKIILIGTIVLILLLVIFIVAGFQKRRIPSKVVITKYQIGQLNIDNTFTIDSKKDIMQLSKYVRKLKPLKDTEQVDLALLKDIEIEYNDSISIGIQTDEKNYCYFVDKKNNISSLSKMPDGLYEWTIDIVNKNS